ncbi:ORF MSV124 putative mRNA capping enzyme small subunit homolog (vaccinia D12L), similar to PIR:S42252 [Melanoplus sanguinipes entomopoxvirus]|uniref:ORF MSV124 putative mRNA capping enzyme small subunit homolog (Vaccinia D12L), similar to PIR:S42252 n=1 Tax=Melanoplus sanguinipes entomopoxvirus TaxID=83191 RepID=Q9YVW8_MSEPV|nr:ORF MSV124 putative mRNA capping enzyme small subunit homolog (vaccinia D12L), similar to PIR:S42252 [Melanoplus sanguinipes entomopoxvirus]AAC97664.1 ORF MSV124 putative mRNA capping enzyme small subunit homolog (vaccinia D12L), similar to PIR:S42252 [Melanoplus sanguinipes entomopoxvirus 'O']
MDIDEKIKNIINNGIYEELPKVNSIPQIVIQSEFGSPKAYFGINYHMLSTIVEIQDTYNENQNLLYFAQYDKVMQSNEKITYDMTFPKFFREGTSIDKSGSSMTNKTYLFCSDLITLNLLYFISKKSNMRNEMTFRLPTITSTAVIHYIIILSYMFNKVAIKKNDMWLTDNFIVECNQLNMERYNTVNHQLKALNINEKNRQIKINGLFSDFTIDEIYKDKIIKLINSIGGCASYLWIYIIVNMKESLKGRSNKIKNEYDKLLKIKE